MRKKFLLVLFIGFVDFSFLPAQSVLPLQNEDPIANFSLNEDDTTRYTYHYLYEQAYQTIADMLVGIPYTIHFYGSQTLTPILPWIK